VNLTTHATNERAIRCYDKCGFVREGLFREEPTFAANISTWLQWACYEPNTTSVSRRDRRLKSFDTPLENN